MMNFAIAPAIILFGASAVASSVGSAIVVNACEYDVYLCDVPAMGGGYTEEDKTLSPGDTWSQQWTQLTNGNGWSIKLSKTQALANIMQYEYTWHDDGTIWYDISDVNGNPWDGNWEITSSTSTCTPKQQAYRYSTDDAYGMQACPQDATITVTLCSGENQNNSTASSISSSVAAESTVVHTSSFSTPSVAVPTFSTASTTSPATSHTSQTYSHHWSPPAADVVESSSAVVTPTTFATSTTAAVEEAPGVTVWEVETAVATEVVTVYHTAPQKRHEHHAGHHHNA